MKSSLVYSRDLAAPKMTSVNRPLELIISFHLIHYTAGSSLLAKTRECVISIVE